jgi:antitoxin (DNA-binding transcriptional repressor) of toxin-antitoxin stability system
MKFITVRDLRTKPATVWRNLKKENELIITNNGKPMALLTPLTDATMEETLLAVRKARTSAALSSMRRIAAETGTASLTTDEIGDEIRKYRSGK